MTEYTGEWSVLQTLYAVQGKRLGALMWDARTGAFLVSRLIDGVPA